jgi:hypothetical protein
VVVQVGVLFALEFANANAGIDSPRVEKLVADFWNDHQFLATGKRNVALVEEVIDMRRQEEAVGAVEALSIRRVTPRFYVASFQVSGLIDPRHATSFLP